MPVVSLEHVAMAYGHVPLLDGADLLIEQGERVCVIGRNGSGKSTLLRVISGDVTPDGGLPTFDAGGGGRAETAPGLGGEPVLPPDGGEGLGVPATGGTFVGSGLAAVVAAGVPGADVPVCGVEGVVVLTFGLTPTPVAAPAGAGGAPFAPGTGSALALGSGWLCGVTGGALAG